MMSRGRRSGISREHRGGHTLRYRVGLLLRRILASFRSHCGFLAVVAVFVILATVDNLLTPPFEAADEHRHYAYVRHLARGYGLPAQGIPVADLEHYGPFQEASQPPLYYALAALVTAGWWHAVRVGI